MEALAALEALEKEQKKPTNKKQRRPASRSSRRSVQEPKTLLSAPSTAKSDYAPSVRSESQGPASRRISFAEPARPSATSKRIWIPTVKASLASGFEFDPRLQKYGIAEQVWERFSRELIELAEVPGPALLWKLHSKAVTARIKKELQYDGDFKRKLRIWNKAFKQRGFQVDLALPGEQLEEPTDAGPADDEEDPKQRDLKRDGKRFRLIVTPNTEKGTSVYSRTSSLTRSVTGEGANLQKAAAAADEAEADNPDNPTDP
ncbi:hypothetical protein LSUE1_G007396 [Lachnellula suecica]|uniref:Uncharacterized protein n=1 Tax=Lachnellula suecica TaxID=602035 RepID=A0A8T9BWV5_9HELO|nr:hypothetical protein LSUE1_G007396 [Lachnellula suecica]